MYSRYFDDLSDICMSARIGDPVACPVTSRRTSFSPSNSRDNQTQRLPLRRCSIRTLVVWVFPFEMLKQRPTRSLKRKLAQLWVALAKVLRLAGLKLDECDTAQRDHAVDVI
jgi:hypothetical protein